MPPEAVVIHGAARGADRLSGRIAQIRGLKVESYPADWAREGKAAGAIRNRRMLDQKPRLVVAFHYNLQESKGTKDCVREALRRGIDVVWVRGVDNYVIYKAKEKGKEYGKGLSGSYKRNGNNPEGTRSA